MDYETSTEIDKLAAALVSAQVAMKPQGAAIGQTGCVAVVTQFTHTSGQWMRSRVEVPYQEQKGTNIAQAYGSALSYARRYALASMACVVAEDDDASTAAPTRDPAPTDEARLLAAIAAAPDVQALAAIAASIRSPSQSVRDAYAARKAALS